MQHRWRTFFSFLGLLAFASVTSALTVQLGHSATIPCHLNCSTVQWWSKSVKVFQFSEGGCSVAQDFEGRIECSEEKIRGGDVSLTISSTVFNDRGWFYCSCDGKDQCDRKIEVLVPTSVSTAVGRKARLPCYAETDKRTADSSAYVLWENNGQQVVKVENGKTSYGSGFEQRVSVSTESYRKGDLSLTIDPVTVSDSGLYRCSLKDGGYGYPNAVTLAVEARQYSHHKKEGDSVQLDLVAPSSVMVYFRDGDVTADSWMCTRPKEAVHCRPGYEERASIINNSLTLRKLSAADSGTYTVNDVRSGDVIAVHKLLVEGLPWNKIPAIAASVSCVAFVVLLGVLLWACHGKQRKQPARGKVSAVPEAEDERVHLSIQQSESTIRSPIPFNDMELIKSLAASSSPEAAEQAVENSML